jgi:CHAD domain-containing protein
MKWISKTIEAERLRLERATQRFLKKPTQERLHEVRTTGRRLRSLLEDVSGLVPLPKLRRQVARAAAITDAARDAAVIYALLDCSVEESERETAQRLLDELAARERQATRVACRRLARLDFT